MDEWRKYYEAQAEASRNTGAQKGKSNKMIQADETPVAVRMLDGTGKKLQAYLWQYSTVEQWSSTFALAWVANCT